MSQAEELLDGLTEEEISEYSVTNDTEAHIVIDPVTRIITVPDALKRIAVQYDHNIETVTFDGPRYWDGIDMSKMTIYVNYTRADGQDGCFLAANVRVDEADDTTIHFEWLISRNVTEKDGSISFSICIKDVDSEGNENVHWNSEINSDMKVSKGKECATTVQEQYPDVLTTLVNKIHELENAPQESVDITQTIGDSETAVMSQKAVTDNLLMDKTIVHGLNLFNVEAITEDVRLDDAGNIIKSSGSCVTDFIPVEPGIAYYFSYAQDNGTRTHLSCRRVIGFNENKEFVALVGTYMANVCPKDANIRYVRMQLETVKATAQAQFEEFSPGGSASEYEPYTVRMENVPIDISNFSMGDLVMAFPSHRESDFTIIDNCIWAFGSSSDDGTANGLLNVYRLDYRKKTARLVRRVYHNFGHCNSVDYCAETDCLIFGNGSGDTALEGKFYVIKNPKQLLLSDTVSLSDYAIEYDCSTLGYGTKMNVVWGHSNCLRYDMALLITKDNKEIRLIQLGKGSNDLGLGTMGAGSTDDEFNGTFKVIKTYIVDDGRTSDFNHDNCNQGSDWYQGRLYIAIGHDITRYWKVTLSTDGTAPYEDVSEPCHDASGNKLTGAIEGICITAEFMILQTVTSTESYINVYKR